jgi:outer membrane assembly lipoprotein YfiO
MKQMMEYGYKVLYVVAFGGLLVFSACSKKNKRKISKPEIVAEITADGLHKEICMAQKEKNSAREIVLLEQAIKEFTESPHLATYTLRLADLYLEKDYLTKAYHLYDNFALLHPTHAYAEYAAYKAIVAQFRQTLKIHRDCDSTTTEETIKLCNNFMIKVFNSEYADHVQDILNTCKERLIEKETYIFHQYIREGKIQSAEKRLAKIKKHFLGDADVFESRILFLDCLLAKAHDDTDRAIEHIELLQEKYPHSPFTHMAVNSMRSTPFKV